MAFILSICLAVIAFLGTNTYVAAQVPVSRIGGQSAILNPMDGNANSLFDSDPFNYDTPEMSDSPAVLQPAMSSPSFVTGQAAQSMNNAGVMGQRFQAGPSFIQPSQRAVNSQSFVSGQMPQSMNNAGVMGQQFQTGQSFPQQTQLGMNSQSFVSGQMPQQRLQPQRVSRRQNQATMGSSSFMTGQMSQPMGNTFVSGQNFQSAPTFSQQASVPMVVPQSAGFQSPRMLAPQYSYGNRGYMYGRPSANGKSSGLSSLLAPLMLTGSMGSLGSSLPLLLLL